MRAARCQAGVSLVEVVVTLLILVVGLMAAMGVFASTGRATLSAQQKTAMVALAQRELERIRPLPYDRIGLSGPVSPDAPALAEPAAGERVVGGGAVAPGPERFSIEGVAGTLYRYVTWRAQPCPVVRQQVAQRVADQLGLTRVQVEASLNADLCPGTQHTKRLTVVMVADASGDGPRDAGSVRLSTVAVDPSATIGATGNGKGLAVDGASATGTGGPPATAPEQAYAAVTQQSHHLHDTPCSFAERQPPTGHHAKRDTAVVGNTCTGSRTPDLMTGAAPAAAAGAPLYDYSDDVERDALGGLALVPDAKAEPCRNTFRHPGTETDRRFSMHTWATPPAGQPAETAASNGRATVNLWTRTANDAPAGGRLCAVLWKQSTGAVLGHGELRLTDWPTALTQLAVSFDVDHAVIEPGDRLMLTLRVAHDSPGGLQLVYDHPSHDAWLSVPMTTGKELVR